MMQGANNIQGIGMTSARTRDRLVERLKSHGIRASAVLEQIRNVPRHLFVDEALASRAYEDTALPIGHSQTISQPYVVAKMTEALLQDFTGDKVLEIGTGCGYQTAMLAPLVKERPIQARWSPYKLLWSISIQRKKPPHRPGGYETLSENLSKKVQRN